MGFIKEGYCLSRDHFFLAVFVLDHFFDRRLNVFTFFIDDHTFLSTTLT